MKAIRRFTVRVTLPEPLAPLHGLMLNLRWSWHAPTADLFASIDPDAWQASGGDPIALLSALPPDRISALAADTDGADGGAGSADDPAGAIIDSATFAKMNSLGLDPGSYLDNNDATAFFGLTGDLLLTGPTLTNVNDIRVILVEGA